MPVVLPPIFGRPIAAQPVKAQASVASSFGWGGVRSSAPAAAPVASGGFGDLGSGSWFGDVAPAPAADPGAAPFAQWTPGALSPTDVNTGDFRAVAERPADSLGSGAVSSGFGSAAYLEEHPLPTELSPPAPAPDPLGGLSTDIVSDDFSDVDEPPVNPPTWVIPGARTAAVLAALAAAAMLAYAFLGKRPRRRSTRSSTRRATSRRAPAQKGGRRG